MIPARVQPTPAAFTARNGARFAFHPVSPVLGVVGVRS